jgi:hypothetical protein
MRLLGIAGLVLALAIVGYLVVSYLHEGTKVEQALQTVPGASGSAQSGKPVDVTKSGLEQRLSPVLNQERQRVQDTDKAANQ